MVFYIDPGTGSMLFTILIGLAGAAIYAAAKELREEGWIREQDRVVLLNTGAGIKYPDTLEVSVPYLEKDAVL